MATMKNMSTAPQYHYPSMTADATPVIGYTYVNEN